MPIARKEEMKTNIGIVGLNKALPKSLITNVSRMIKMDIDAVKLPIGYR